MTKRINISKNKKFFTHVIAGKLKKMKIENTPGEIRPMTSLVKKALFDIINDFSKITDMLDLFCGSGNISIEAYSRGIKNADLIEADRFKKDVIEKNLKKAGFDKANLIITDALVYCKNCNKNYDFIMVDPPFKWDKKNELLKLISEKNLLNDNGFLVIHLPKKENLDNKIADLECYDSRKYGINKLLFYKKII
jgi:16S rRNA (guanine966-N2)-methyltransferase